jgi:hypothetical protein
VTSDPHNPAREAHSIAIHMRSWRRIVAGYGLLNPAAFIATRSIINSSTTTLTRISSIRCGTNVGPMSNRTAASGIGRNASHAGAKFCRSKIDSSGRATTKITGVASTSVSAPIIDAIARCVCSAVVAGMPHSRQRSGAVLPVSAWPQCQQVESLALD